MQNAVEVGRERGNDVLFAFTSSLRSDSVFNKAASQASTSWSRFLLFFTWNGVTSGRGGGRLVHHNEGDDEDVSREE